MSEPVVLRELRPGDASLAARWKNDPEIRDLVAGYFLPTTEAEEQEWIQRNASSRQSSRIVYAISQKREGPAIGFSHLSDVQWVHRTATVGMFIGEPEMRRKGLGTSALRQLISLAFDVLNLRKLSLQVVATNAPAIHLYKRHGFRQEGCLKMQFFLAGEYRDALLMALHRDYEPAGAPTNCLQEVNDA